MIKIFRQVEPMHLTSRDRDPRRRTACGLDSRGRRSSRDPAVTTCKLCRHAVALSLVKRGVIAAKVPEIKVLPPLPAEGAAVVAFAVEDLREGLGVLGDDQERSQGR